MFKLERTKKSKLFRGKKDYFLKQPQNICENVMNMKLPLINNLLCLDLFICSSYFHMIKGELPPKRCF